MTSPKTSNKTVIYQCKECGLNYTSKEIASQCEEWCRVHKSCNLDIIKHAIEPKAGEIKST